MMAVMREGEGQEGVDKFIKTLPPVCSGNSRAMGMNRAVAPGSITVVFLPK